MNKRCSVCGCVAQPGELVNYEIFSTECEICSVCRKQLTAINQNPKEKAGLAREMLFMDTKGHRNAVTQDLIETQFSLLGINTALDAVREELPQENRAQNEELENKVKELQTQVENLKNEFNSFRRRYYLMKILSVAVPVVLVIIMLVIIFASGALDSLFDYYSAIQDMAEM